MSSHRPLHGRSLSAAASITVALLITACGGSNKPPAPKSPGQGSRSTAVDAAYQYADCMRGHGVSAFQDPHVHQSGNSMSIGFHVDPQITGSPAFKSAQRACAHILPQPSGAPSAAEQHAREQAFVAFAACMRRHGFPRFPDPNSQGRLTPAMLSAARINLRQPAIKPAAYACVPVTHGMVTRAEVDQAVANPSGGSQSASGG